FDEIRQYAGRRPVLAANGVKELLDRFRAIGAVHSQFTDRLKTVSNTFFMRLCFACRSYSICMFDFVTGMHFFSLTQASLKRAESRLLACVLFARRIQLPV